MSTNRDQLFPGKSGKGLKIMIQVDFEGVTNVVNWDEIYPGHAHFDRNCDILTGEINAAVAGAFAAGATEIIVRDGHAGNINVNPLLLDPRVKLTKGRVPGTPHTMVLGIDSTFDALMFIGAHARAGEQMGTLSHTMSLKVLDFRINGKPLFEAAFNALYAAQFGVPVVFLSGDNMACKEAYENFGPIETVETKHAYGRTCAMSKSPQVVNLEIRESVERALRNLDRGCIYEMNAPYIMELEVTQEESDEPLRVRYQSDILYDVMKKFWEYL